MCIRDRSNENDSTSLPYTKVISIYEDSRKRLWFMTLGEGFCPVSYTHLASYLRLKNLSLAYTLPKAMTRKAFIENARLFFTASNLWTIANVFCFRYLYLIGKIVTFQQRHPVSHNIA